MKLKAVLLGSAALLGQASGALAADLPVAEPLEYARICNAVGIGYFYIPNTDTCLKISGYIRAESHWVDGDTEVLRPGGAKSEFNNRTTRVRAAVMIEANTSTDIGDVYTYIELRGTRGPEDYGDPYGENLEIPAAYIQVSNNHGMFTAGHYGSFFDFYSSDDYGTRIDIDDNTTEANLFAYTFNFGTSGLKGTLSIEDPDSNGRRFDGADDYEGLEMPDLVGNLRYEQSWGAAQVMGAGRHIHDVNGDGFGWAAGAGVVLNLPIDKATFSTQVGYADGALGYITTDPGRIGDFDGPDGDNTNQAWMARGGFYVPFADKFSVWLDGSYTHAEDDTNDDEYDYWTVVAGGAWQRSELLSMGPEFGYNNIDGDDPGEDGELWGVMWRVESQF